MYTSIGWRWNYTKLTDFLIIEIQKNYRVSENEGQPEKGYKTLKIGGLDHLFGISVIYT